MRPAAPWRHVEYYKDDVEQAGLVKFDFLGLKTLTVVDIAQHLIHGRAYGHERRDDGLELVLRYRRRRGFDGDARELHDELQHLRRHRRGDFHLTKATTAGTTLPLPFSADADGVARGADDTWDRGAFERK